jgi:hypothetical protein
MDMALGQGGAYIASLLFLGRIPYINAFPTDQD